MLETWKMYIVMKQDNRVTTTVLAWIDFKPTVTFLSPAMHAVLKLMYFK